MNCVCLSMTRVLHVSLAVIKDQQVIESNNAPALLLKSLLQRLQLPITSRPPPKVPTQLQRTRLPLTLLSVGTATNDASAARNRCCGLNVVHHSRLCTTIWRRRARALRAVVHP